jgi:hypothetical protein
MLKRITRAGLFALSIAFLTAGAASAHAATKKAHPVTVTPTAPHGFCWPIGSAC